MIHDEKLEAMLQIARQCIHCRELSGPLLNKFVILSLFWHPARNPSSVRGLHRDPHLNTPCLLCEFFSPLYTELSNNISDGWTYYFGIPFKCTVFLFDLPSSWLSQPNVRRWYVLRKKCSGPYDQAFISYLTLTFCNHVA